MINNLAKKLKKRFEKSKSEDLKLKFNNFFELLFQLNNTIKSPVYLLIYAFYSPGMKSTPSY